MALQRDYGFANMHDLQNLCTSQVENTAQVAAAGPFANNVSARGVYIQRLDADPSVSLVMVRPQRCS